MLIKPNMFRILASSYQDLNSETWSFAIQHTIVP